VNQLQAILGNNSIDRARIYKIPQWHHAREYIIERLREIIAKEKYDGVVTDSPKILRLFSEEPKLVQCLFWCKWSDVQIKFILSKDLIIDVPSQLVDAFLCVRAYTTTTDWRRSNKGKLTAKIIANAHKQKQLDADTKALSLVFNIVAFIKDLSESTDVGHAKSISALQKHLLKSWFEIKYTRTVTKIYERYTHLMENENSDYQENAFYQLLKNEWQLIKEYFDERKAMYSRKKKV
jgi:hypothetical protein